MATPREVPQHLKQMSAPASNAQDNYRHIVRIANTDLEGTKTVLQALRRIKGVSFMYANMVCALAKVDRYQRTGALSETHVQKIEDVLLHPNTYEVPPWMKNRRLDYETGEDRHLIGPTLKFVQETDIRRLKKIRSYKGVRHTFGLPVRGQRTKSNFRKNKGNALGVKKSGAKAAPAAAPAK